MVREVIDIDFINNWEIKYDFHEGDENNYKSILQLVAIDIKNSNTISKNTFIQIINWKSPRLKGIIKLADYVNYYKPIIERCIAENDLKTKLKLLISLYGVYIPSATTILHFIYPEVFPIIDFRTAETLKYFGKLMSKGISENNYWEFFNIIHRIKSDTNVSLRKIDRALFSYHKLYLKYQTALCNAPSEIKPLSQPNKKSAIMEHAENFRKLENYIFISYEMSIYDFAIYLANKYISDSYQRDIFLKEGIWLKVRLNYVAGLILTSRGKDRFAPIEIREIIRKELIPSISDMNDANLSSLILTQDVHDKAKKEYNNGYPCLKKVGRGAYKFIVFS